MQLVSAVLLSGCTSRRHWRVTMSHTRKLPSSDADTSVTLSSEHARAVTARVCPSSTRAAPPALASALAAAEMPAAAADRSTT